MDNGRDCPGAGTARQAHQEAEAGHRTSASKKRTAAENDRLDSIVNASTLSMWHYRVSALCLCLLRQVERLRRYRTLNSRLEARGDKRTERQMILEAEMDDIISNLLRIDTLQQGHPMPDLDSSQDVAGSSQSKCA